MPAQPQTFSLPNVLSWLGYGIAFLLVPLFFIGGAYDTWNLPRWGLLLAFLTGAFALLPLQKKSPDGLVWPIYALLLFWVMWTLLASTQPLNAGDTFYLLGIRAAGLGLLIWLSLQPQPERVLWPLLGLGLIEVLIGAGEFAGIVEMSVVLEPPLGTTGNQNMYGSLVALLVPAPLLLALRAPQWRRMALLGLAACMGVMVLVSGSKTGILALGLGGGVSGILYLLMAKRAQIPVWMKIGLPLVPVAVIVVPILWAGINFAPGQMPHENPDGISERGMIWRETIAMAADRPGLGWGPAGWKYEMLSRGYTGYNEVYGLRFFTRPHNDFLWLAAEMGLPAALAYIGLLVFLFRRAVLRAGAVTDKEERLRWLLPAMGILGWCVVSSLYFPLERVDHWVVFAALVVLVGKETGKGMGKWGKMALGILGAIGFAWLTWGAWGRIQQDQSYQEVVLAVQKGEHDRVLELCGKMERRYFSVDYFSSTPLPWYEGLAHLQKGNPTQARGFLLEAYSINPHHPHLLNNLGSVHVMLNDYSTAQRYYREAVDVFPDFADPYINLSRILVAEGQRSEAIRLLKSYPESQPYHGQAVQRELELISN